MGKRKSASKKLRFTIFERDAFTCQYCGRRPPEAILECDHVVPVASGGDNEPSNLITSCQDCNSGKGARNLSAVPGSLARSPVDRAEMIEQMAAFNEFQCAQRVARDQMADEVATYWRRCGGLAFDVSRRASVKRFLVDLTVNEVIESVDGAFSRKPMSRPTYDDTTWRYFCGICWSRIKEAR